MEGGVDEERTSQDAPRDDAAQTAGEATGDNKFQTAIGAWRSMASIQERSNRKLTMPPRHRPHVAHTPAGHRRLRPCRTPERLAHAKERLGTEDEGLPEAGRCEQAERLQGLVEVYVWRSTRSANVTLTSVAYQSFIDVISNQSKTVQAAFFQIYSPLSEAPDPYPLLEASIDSLVTAEETVPKLTSENQHLQKTVASLTSQLDTTEKKLEEERTARKALEDSRDAKIKEVEASWSAVLAEKQDNWEAKEKSYEEKVESQEKLLKELKASYEVSQRLGKGEEAEGDTSRGATAAELEIVSSELERTSHRLAEVEARNEQLRLELAQSASAQATQSVPVEDDPAFLRLQSENSSLLRKLETARFEKESERTRLGTETRGLEREIKSLKSEKEALREKVQKWSDYENVKQELEVLKVRIMTQSTKTYTNQYSVYRVRDRGRRRRSHRDGPLAERHSRQRKRRDTRTAPPRTQ
jgi:homeobox protein cut-like